MSSEYTLERSHGQQTLKIYAVDLYLLVRILRKSTGSNYYLLILFY